MSTVHTTTIVALVLGFGATSARAGIDLPPVTSLPATPTNPYLWFDGGSTSALNDLKARASHPRTVAFYNALKAYVDTRLATITTADDDTRSKFVKAAALLQVLGQHPPSTYQTYRAAAVAAFVGVGSREAIDTVGELIVPPPNPIDILQDSSRLQSLAEGYDMLRNSGVASDDNDKMRGVVANWADALTTDYNLAGAAGIPGHRDNWGIKGGSALVTAALALPDHASAKTWLDTGSLYLNESLDVVASTTGWFGESVWYLNYSLANLLPAAWHARNAAKVDWFPSLEPLVLASFAWRQPDGTAPPFEEGLANTFPWNALASAYPALAPSMLWAWDQSPKNVENFENQQMHDVTRFLLVDLTTVAAAPAGPVTRMLPDDAHLHALRTGWDTQALQLTSITARDYSTSEINTTRHNMRNPLDLVLHGGGALLVPTASGGPTVTSSPNRSSYLSVLAKNIPLVQRNAPFVVALSGVDFGDRVDSEDEGALPNHYADLGLTTLTQVYENTREVSRLVALIDRTYAVVLDRFAASQSRSFELSWRGRGTRITRANSTGLQAFSWLGVSAGGPRLDVDVVGNTVIAGSANASFYAPAWNQEEAIDGVLVGSTGTLAAFVTVMQVVPNNTSPRVITSVGGGSLAAVNVASGSVKDTILVQTGTGSVAVDGVESDGFAAMVRRDAGTVGAIAMVDAREVRVGAARVTTSARTTLALTTAAPGIVVELTVRGGTIDLELDALPGTDGARPYRAKLEGASLGFNQNGTRFTFFAIGSGTLVIDPVPCNVGSGADPDGDQVCGAADNCPTVANPGQENTDNDALGNACECLDAATRCDDQNGCTGDECAPTTGACSHTPIAQACDDQDACTTGDTCTGGVCSGSERSCDDGNACTDDGCAPASGCTYAAKDGEPCDDGEVCTDDDRCEGDTCGGLAVVCDDGNECTIDACQPGTGCVIGGNLNTAACDDGSACTDGDHCSGPTCVGDAIACDDADPCTDDACDPASGCTTTPASGTIACDDDDRCTREDHCAAGLCGGDALDCDDGNPCTVDACDVALGCQHASATDGDACDDGNACTSDDACAAGDCVGLGLQCDDDNPCTNDTCALGSGCATAPKDDGAPCDDDDPCTDEDQCADGECGGLVACDDSDPCTVDACEPSDGACAHTALCAADEVCEEGACRPIDAEPDPEVVEQGPDAEGAEDGPDGEERAPEIAESPDDDVDPDPPDGAESVNLDAEGLDFSESEPQKIGRAKDEGCHSSPPLGTFSGVFALLLSAVLRRSITKRCVRADR